MMIGLLALVVLVGIVLVFVDGIAVLRKEKVSRSSRTESLLYEYRAYVRSQRISSVERFLEGRGPVLSVMNEDIITLNELQKDWDLVYSQS